jgi:uncharacterized membrane protein YphA (DoxX/SURF4 family)
VGTLLRRLFSTFAQGWPGAGLLIIRLVAGGAGIAHGFMALRTGPSIEPAIVDALAIVSGILLWAGLWTPVSGSVLAVLEIWSAISQSGDPWTRILLSTIGVALAMIGPGVWSVDARLFGWRRIEVRDRKR